MTFLDMLRDAGATNQSMLCVGLDPEPSRFPTDLKGNANKIYDFCARIVDATADLVSAFKLHWSSPMLMSRLPRESCSLPPRPRLARPG